MKTFWFVVDHLAPALSEGLVIVALMAHVWMHYIWIFDARGF